MQYKLIIRDFSTLQIVNLFTNLDAIQAIEVRSKLKGDSFGFTKPAIYETQDPKLKIGLVNEYPTMHYFGILRHTQ